MTLKDQLGRNIKLSGTPKRIVSLVPSQTELLVDLDLEDELVGITKFCVHPKRLLKEKRIVGGTKSIHIDRVKSLKPDIILCNKEENTKEMVSSCEKIAQVHVSDVSTLEDNYQMMQQYGKLFNVEENAERVISETRVKAKEFQRTIKNRKRPKVAYLIWRKPYMVAGGDTFINTLLEEAGFANAYKEKNRYPEVSLQQLAENELDYIFLSSEPFPFKEKYKIDFKDYFEEEKLRLVDGEYFSWYGSRLLKAFDYFEELHVKISLPVPTS